MPASAREGSPNPAASAPAQGLRWLGLILALALQLSHALPRLDEPLIDGRMHLAWDNARFLLRARHSNTPPEAGVHSSGPEWLRVLGTAHYEYDDGGRPSRLSFYGHHPVLVPALFRAWTRVAGYEPAAARSFGLCFSLANTALLWLYLGAALSGSAWAGFLTLLYTLLPLPYQFVDVWKYETPANLLLLGALAALPVATRSASARALLYAALALLPQVDWNVYFGLPVLLWPLWRARRSAGAARVLRTALAVLGVSTALDFALLYGLGFDLAHMGSQSSYRMSSGLGGVSGWGRWGATQWTHLRSNLGITGLALGAAALCALCDARLRRPNPPLHAALCFAVSGILWIGVFRNLSLIHPFVQWSFVTALVLLLAGLLQNARRAFPLRRRRSEVALALLACALLPLVWLEASAHERRIRSLAFGTRADLEALWPLQCRRLLIGSAGESGPASWWLDSPVVEAALDPIWQGAKGRNCSLRQLEFTRVLASGDVIAVARTGDAAARMQALLRERFPAARVTPRAQSPSFVFLEVGEAPGAR